MSCLIAVCFAYARRGASSIRKPQVGGPASFGRPATSLPYCAAARFACTSDAADAAAQAWAPAADKTVRPPVPAHGQSVLLAAPELEPCARLASTPALLTRALAQREDVAGERH